MKLQINNSGSWKTVVVTEMANIQQAMSLAAKLTELDQPAGKAATWRVLDGTEAWVAIYDPKRGYWKHRKPLSEWVG